MKNSGKITFVILTVLGMVCMSFTMCQTFPETDSEVIRNPAEFEPSPKPVIVAVIDTGFDFESDWKELLKERPDFKKPRTCKYGNKDFTGMGIKDNHGHGTHIAGLIAKHAGDSNYCLVILKYFDPLAVFSDNLNATKRAFQRAIDLKVNMINYSNGGEENSREECLLIKKALDLGIVVVTAAGNEGKNINNNKYYPAMCDTRVRVVANVDVMGEYVKSSNYSDNGPRSRHLYKEIGLNVLSLAPGNNMGYMTGTSQSAAVQTGKIIKDWNKH